MKWNKLFAKLKKPLIIAGSTLAVAFVAGFFLNCLFIYNFKFRVDINLLVDGKTYLYAFLLSVIALTVVLAYYYKHYWLKNSKKIIQGDERDNDVAANLEQAHFQTDEEVDKNYAKVSYLYELDYASHCAKAKNSAVYIAQVRLYSRDRNIIMAYSDDWRLKAREYDCDKREFIPLSQNKLDTLLENMQQERLNGHYYPWDEEKLRLEYGETPTYSIYQLKPQNYGRLFMSYHRTKEKGFTVKANDYELAYIADNADGRDLDEIYEEFNLDRPDDFCGHSLSVSDVIAYKHEDGSTEV